jgi:hypothetical protein
MDLACTVPAVSRIISIFESVAVLGGLGEQEDYVWALVLLNLPNCTSSGFSSSIDYIKCTCNKSPTPEILD